MTTQSAGIYFLMPLLFMLMTLCGSFMVQAQKPDWQDSIHGSYLHDYKKYEAKDKALNLIYRDLKAQLSEDEYSLLRDVQRSWVLYKKMFVITILILVMIWKFLSWIHPQNG
ncbi:lysozyme inhibitor LprI family protein [Photobacterium sp. R1]